LNIKKKLKLLKLRKEKNKMAGTKEGGVKAAQRNKELHGDDFYARIGAKGGRNGHTGGFAGRPDLARLAGKKGGLKSRRTGIKNGEGAIHTKEYTKPWGE
jgi:general stress protein YciG